MLEPALGRLALALRGLAEDQPLIDALETYLDLARPIVADCNARDRIWVNARIEDIWSACPAVARRAGRITRHDFANPGRKADPAAVLADPIPQGPARAAPLPDTRAAIRSTGFGLGRR